jgi:hypothetical protein
MRSSDSLEIAIQFPGPSYFRRLDSITDIVNGIEYSIGKASQEYCVFILDSIAETVMVGENEQNQRVKMRINRGLMNRDGCNTDIELADLLRIDTLKVKSTNANRSINELRKLASSFEFHYMYKKGQALSEYTNVTDMYNLERAVYRKSRKFDDTPPQRFYNDKVIDYYTMALESRDPFMAYISFYHIVEYYFDAVFRKKLTDEMRQRLTHPDFSYKNERKLYEFAKFIRKSMSSDDGLGKGNEFESLKYVLMEYVPIEELKKMINELDSNAITYYQNNYVPFTTSKKTKIAWADNSAVYTNLATRIYETRNALVHSKSEQLNNQYRPYKNKKDLIAEMALIRSAAELVIINSSEIV